MPPMPAARLTDLTVCPCVGGPIATGSVNVITGFLPQAHMLDATACVCSPDPIVKTSFTVFVNFLGAARMGDLVASGGVITTGCVTVLIGD